MKRRHFLLLSAIMAWAMSAAMFLSPSMMLNDTLPGANPMGELLIRIVAAIVFCVGVINFAARRDVWSDSMKAILLGNALMHLLLIALDAYGYVNGLVGTRSVVMSMILHGALMVGFFVALTNPSRQDDVVMSAAN
jgi:hypothetical protein